MFLEASTTDIKPGVTPLEDEAAVKQAATIMAEDGWKGKLIGGVYGESPRLIPESKMKEYKLPPRTIPRVEGSHEQDWVRACKGGKPASSNFDFSGPLSEMVLMGNLAVRFPNRKLLWDGEKMQATNAPPSILKGSTWCLIAKSPGAS